MAAWFWYAVVAAVLYGAHQIFTRMAADHIGEGLGGFVVEATAALSILLYLAFLWLAGPLESAIQRAGNFLFRSYRNLRRRWNDCILPAFSKRRPALVRFQRFSRAARRLWPSQASCFSAKHHHGSESLALRSPSLVCFCCGNSFRSCQTQVLARNSAHRFSKRHDGEPFFGLLFCYFLLLGNGVSTSTAVILLSHLPKRR